MKNLFWRSCFILPLILGQAGPGAGRGFLYLYDERWGSETWVGRYLVESVPGGRSLSYQNPKERHSMLLDDALACVEWSWSRLDGSASATASVRGSRLSVEGTRGERSWSSSQALEGLPWYQAPDFSLSRLAARRLGDRQAFWMIDPDDFSFHRMVARNAGPDRFRVGGADLPALRVVVAVSGVPELIWKNECWYAPDGTYLGFSGRRGGPFSTAGTLRLIRSEETN